MLFVFEYCLFVCFGLLWIILTLFRWDVVGCDWLFWCLLFVSACMDCFAIVACCLDGLIVLFALVWVV